MNNKCTRNEGGTPGASKDVSSDKLKAYGWEADDFDLDDEELDPMFEMQIELPLRAESFVNGEPRVIVDYFGFEPNMRDTIVARLHTLPKMVVDVGADLPRFLLFEGEPVRGGFVTRDLIAIISVRDREVRVETDQAGTADSIRRTVETILGDRVRHRRRRSENPLADCW